MSKVEQVTCFKYGERLFESEAEAQQAEGKDNLLDWLNSQGVGRGGEWDTDRFFSHLCENFERYIMLLNKLY